MDSISAASSSAGIQQSVLAMQEAQGQMNTAILAKAQQSDKQQGAAAVQLIEAAGRVVDVKV